MKVYMIYKDNITAENTFEAFTTDEKIAKAFEELYNETMYLVEKELEYAEYVAFYDKAKDKEIVACKSRFGFGIIILRMCDMDKFIFERCVYS